MEGKSDISKLLNEIEIKAIKRFADRLKARASILCDKVTGKPCSYMISSYEFDNLVKEMEGESK